MTWALGFALTLAGLACLALSQPKHRRAALGAAAAGPREALGLRVAGWAALAAAAAWCASRFGLGYGLVAAVALLTVAGVAVALFLTYGAPRAGGRSGR